MNEECAYRPSTASTLTSNGLNTFSWDTAYILLSSSQETSRNILPCTAASLASTAVPLAPRAARGLQLEAISLFVDARPLDTMRFAVSKFWSVLGVFGLEIAPASPQHTKLYGCDFLSSTFMSGLTRKRSNGDTKDSWYDTLS